MNVQSTSYCLAIEIRSTVYSLSEKKLMVICPFDKGQLEPLKKSIKNAYD